MLNQLSDPTLLLSHHGAYPPLSPPPPPQPSPSDGKRWVRLEFNKKYKTEGIYTMAM